MGLTGGGGAGSDETEGWRAGKGSTGWFHCDTGAEPTKASSPEHGPHTLALQGKLLRIAQAERERKLGHPRTWSDFHLPVSGNDVPSSCVGQTHTMALKRGTGEGNLLTLFGGRRFRQILFWNSWKSRFLVANCTLMSPIAHRSFLPLSNKNVLTGRVAISSETTCPCRSC